jgi:hypothetical protein
MKTAPYIVLAAITLAPASALAQSIDDSVVTEPGEDPELGKRHGFTASFSAGFAYRNVYDISISAADLEVFLGGRTRHVDIGGSVVVLLGATERDLFVSNVSVGPTFVFPVNRWVRLGVGAQTSVLSIARVTRDEAIHTPGVGLNARVSVDLMRGESFALFFGGRIGFDALASEPSTVLLGGTAMFGVRH